MKNELENPILEGADEREEGSAMVIALLIMVLLMGFVALAITRTSSETISSNNDAAESRVFDACHASLELMTKNFTKVFENSLTVTPADITRIRNQDPEDQYPADFGDFIFDQQIAETTGTESVILTEGQFQGLTAFRDEWEFTSPCEDRNGVSVTLNRRFYNNRIPIFQFGIFYDDDLEFHPGPRFDFGGRVHSNGNMFLAAQTGLYFSSKVTARGHVLSNVQKNGRPASDWGENVFIRNASGAYQRLSYNRGSALTSPVNGTAVTSSPLPTAYRNANWATQHLTVFQGNLLAEQRPLDLPLEIAANQAGQRVDLREIVKRGKSIGDLWNNGTGTVANPTFAPVATADEDTRITKSERYYNKTGIRISLADSKQKLPGCASMTAAATDLCGIRLDGDISGRFSGAAAEAIIGTLGPFGGRGYQPRAMTGLPAYQATRINGDRFHVRGREAWIKVETVRYNEVTLTYDTVDITEDILALGVTEPAPAGAIAGYGNTDSRSVIKLQRFAILGPGIPRSGSGTNTYITHYPAATPTSNYVMPATVLTGENCLSGTTPVAVNQGTSGPNTGAVDDRRHWRNADLPSGGIVECVVPFPINIFDTREGLYFEPTSNWLTSYPISSYWNGTGGYFNIPWNGVMSMVDIDVQNLREFLMGDTSSTNGYDGGAGNPAMANNTPFAIANGRPLLSTDIPQPTNTIPKAGGWVFYISDRRGDYDFDGNYDMEDIYGETNGGTAEPGEDVNQNNVLERWFSTGQYVNGSGGATEGTCPLCEGVRYTGTNNSVNNFEAPDKAAVFDHKYYRRGVRLIRGSRVPGKYDTVDAENTSGFTVASENAVYVQGNYNATGVTGTGHAQAINYLPQNDEFHIPASIAADAVIILSNSWNDARSFASPFSLNQRTPQVTYMRFAMIGGDSMTSLSASPNQGGGNPRMNGGVHNFKRFLENWNNSTRLYYSGSLINLFNAQNNNGAFKCCNVVYSPPERNWIFDSTFLDPNRIPPGTPSFQSIQITGFQRVN